MVDAVASKIVKCSIHHPHDSVFKQSMRHVQVAKEIFETYLPESILSILSLDTLSLTNSVYIDDDYTQTQSDILYKVEVNSENSNSGSDVGYIYIMCEHQSKPHKWMPLRFLRYMCCVMNDHIKQGGKYLPLIVPILIYNGNQIYPYSCDIYDYFQDPNIARSIMFKPFELVDLRRIPDDKLLKNNWSGFLQMLLKYLRETDFLPYFEKLVKSGNVKFLVDNDAEQLIKNMIYCIIDQTQILDIDKFIELLKLDLDNLGRDLMTPLQHKYTSGMVRGFDLGIQKGIQKGIQRGTRDGFRSAISKMLAKGFDAKEVASIVDVDISEVEYIRLSLASPKN